MSQCFVFQETHFALYFRKNVEIANVYPRYIQYSPFQTYYCFRHFIKGLLKADEQIYANHIVCNHGIKSLISKTMVLCSWSHKLWWVVPSCALASFRYSQNHSDDRLEVSFQMTKQTWDIVLIGTLIHGLRWNNGKFLWSQCHQSVLWRVLMTRKLYIACMPWKLIVWVVALTT